MSNVVSGTAGLPVATPAPLTQSQPGIIVQKVNIPGPPGPPGINAFTVTTAPFDMPTADGVSLVYVAVEESRWAAVGQDVYIETAGVLLVATATDNPLVLGLVNPPGTSGNAAPATVIASGKKVSPNGSAGGGGGSAGTVVTGINLPNTNQPINLTQDQSAADVLVFSSSSPLLTGNIYFINYYGDTPFTAKIFDFSQIQYNTNGGSFDIAIVANDQYTFFTQYLGGDHAFPQAKRFLVYWSGTAAPVIEPLDSVPIIGGTVDPIRGQTVTNSTIDNAHLVTMADSPGQLLNGFYAPAGGDQSQQYYNWQYGVWALTDNSLARITPFESNTGHGQPYVLHVPFPIWSSPVNNGGRSMTWDRGNNVLYVLGTNVFGGFSIFYIDTTPIPDPTNSYVESIRGVFNVLTTGDSISTPTHLLTNSASFVVLHAGDSTVYGLDGYVGGLVARASVTAPAQYLDILYENESLWAISFSSTGDGSGGTKLIRYEFGSGAVLDTIHLSASPDVAPIGMEYDPINNQIVVAMPFVPYNAGASVTAQMAGLYFIAAGEEFTPGASLINFWPIGLGTAPSPTATTPRANNWAWASAPTINQYGVMAVARQPSTIGTGYDWLTAQPSSHTSGDWTVFPSWAAAGVVFPDAYAPISVYSVANGTIPFAWLNVPQTPVSLVWANDGVTGFLAEAVALRSFTSGVGPIGSGGTEEQVMIGGQQQWVQESSLPIASSIDYSPAVPGNWSPAPSLVSTGLDQLAATTKSQGTTLATHTTEIATLTSDFNGLTAATLSYAPGVPGNWSPSPTDVGPALDQLAVKVQSSAGTGFVSFLALNANPSASPTAGYFNIYSGSFYEGSERYVAEDNPGHFEVYGYTGSLGGFNAWPNY